MVQTSSGTEARQEFVAALKSRDVEELLTVCSSIPNREKREQIDW